MGTVQHSELSAIEDGMLNSRRVERSVVSSVRWGAPTAAEPSDHRHPVTRPPFSPRQARCAHLDKLNYKLDGSLVATRGNVVGAWICMIYTRNPTHRYNSRQPVARVGEPWETSGETARLSLNSTSIQSTKRLTWRKNEAYRFHNEILTYDEKIRGPNIYDNSIIL